MIGDRVMCTLLFSFFFRCLIVHREIDQNMNSTVEIKYLVIFEILWKQVIFSYICNYKMWVIQLRMKMSMSGFATILLLKSIDDDIFNLLCLGSLANSKKNDCVIYGRSLT